MYIAEQMRIHRFNAYTYVRHTIHQMPIQRITVKIFEMLLRNLEYIFDYTYLQAASYIFEAINNFAKILKREMTMNRHKG